jgi:hypothetical protein
MRILVLEAIAGAAPRELDAKVSSASLDEYEAALAPHLLNWKEIETIREELAVDRPYPEGDMSRIGLDEPIFGLHNPPEPDRYLFENIEVGC